MVGRFWVTDKSITVILRCSRLLARASKDDRPRWCGLLPCGPIGAVALRGPPKKEGGHLRVTGRVRCSRRATVHLIEECCSPPNSNNGNHIHEPRHQSADRARRAGLDGGHRCGLCVLQRGGVEPAPLLGGELELDLV